MTNPLVRSNIAASRSGLRWTQWAVNTLYVLTTLALAGWCGYVFLFHSSTIQLLDITGDIPPRILGPAQLQFLTIAVLLIASQIVFLLPFFRRRLHRGVSTTIVGLLIADAGLQTFLVGWLGIIGGIGLAPGEPFPYVFWIARTIAYAMPTIALAFGATVIRLSIAIPPRRRSALGFLVSTLALLGLTTALV